MTDDIVMMSHNPEKLQTMINGMKTWCNKWRMG